MTPGSVLVYSYFTMCSEKSEHNCVTSYWYDAAILASFFFIRVFKGVLSSELVDQEQKNANGNQQKTRAMRGNAMRWYYHHKWDGNGMGWDGSRNFVPITSYHPITITVICTTHQLPVGGMSAYTIPSTFPSHHPELLPIPSTTHLSNFQPSHHIPIFSHPDTTAQQSFSWIFPRRQAPYPP